MQDLATRLNALCDAQPFVTSWYVKDLATGWEADRGGDTVLPSASTRKISIMMHALSKVHEGKLRLDEPCTIEARLQEGVKSGTYQFMTPGCVIPFRDVLVNMIITSDNVCTQIALEHLDREELNAWCRRIGMKSTTHRVNFPAPDLPWDVSLTALASTTARDQGLLLDLMLKGSTDAEAAAFLGATPELCQLGLDILSWQRLRNLIPCLLPDGTKVANKTGKGQRGRMDAGIVYKGNTPRFIITVYMDQVPETMPDGLPGASAMFATAGRLTRLCWDSMN
ncbi:serine hydrolase [Roseomonas sp. HJA6]|uniref:Serine hydrolase n=1 Tax=Roseomonas alba TaxID=2846776 RepID=A0ABS7ACC9_9PROT|nr:serine hydrolase [Neoroseomonas alba]MBW6399720.1 serine hydrolase [Neoroseomonas alba]